MKKLLFFIAVFFIPVLLFSQHIPKAVKISGDLYEVALDGCNSAFLVTDSGVIVVDAGISPLDGWQLKRSIAEITKKTVKYVIITHHHFDHIGGVQVFLPGAQVIAQSGMFPNVEKCGMSLMNGFVEE
ncbi:MAG: MBL fold metallo-hydrolase, partial [Bacteroidota bacterium]